MLHGWTYFFHLQHYSSFEVVWQAKQLLLGSGESAIQKTPADHSPDQGRGRQPIKHRSKALEAGIRTPFPRR
jgi:hypothetical protein